MHVDFYIKRGLASVHETYLYAYSFLHTYLEGIKHRLQRFLCSKRSHKIGGFGVVLARANTDPDNYAPFLVQTGTTCVAIILTVFETALVISGIRSFRALNEKEKKYIVRLQDHLKFELGDNDNQAVSCMSAQATILIFISHFDMFDICVLYCILYRYWCCWVCSTHIDSFVH